MCVEYDAWMNSLALGNDQSTHILPAAVVCVYRGCDFFPCCECIDVCFKWPLNRVMEKLNDIYSVHVQLFIRSINPYRFKINKTFSAVLLKYLLR